MKALLILFLFAQAQLFLASMAFGYRCRQARFVMGTVARVEVWQRDEASCQIALETAFAQIKMVDQLMSNFKPDSDLARINQQGAISPVKVDPLTFKAIALSLDYSRLTHGAFDITVGPLVEAWGFYSGQPSFPSKAELRTRLALVGYEAIELDPKASTVFLAKRGMKLDLGGIAKGFALDQAAQALANLGVSTAMLDLGGNLYFLGEPVQGSLWKAALVDGRNLDLIRILLDIKGGAVASSAAYERFFEWEGKRYGHIIDPGQGRPAWGLLSATVIAPLATQADALSTALYVMGLDQGLRLLERLAEVEAILVTEDSTVRTSSGLECVTPEKAEGKLRCTISPKNSTYPGSGRAPN